MDAKDKAGPDCDARVPGSRGFIHQCLRKGVVEDGGKFYCKQHSAAGKKAREDKFWAKYNSDTEKRDAIHRRRMAEVSACAGISTSALEAGAVKELVEALNTASGTTAKHLSPIDKGVMFYAISPDSWRRIQAALARIEGGG